MKENLPEPPTPSECDLRDYTWMPIDITRLLSSETWILASPEGKIAALTLWMKSWHQVPAASLPNNERVISHLSESGAAWPEIRDEVLRGWIKCSDGRLYHPVVAEKAMEAWEHKIKQRQRTEVARAAATAEREAKAAEKAARLAADKAKAEQAAADYAKAEAAARAEAAALKAQASAVNGGKGAGSRATFPLSAGGVAVTVTESVTDPATEIATASNRPYQTLPDLKEEEGGVPPLPPRGNGRSRAVREDPEFGEFYAAYPRKEAPDDALKAYRQARRAGASHCAIMAGLARYRFSEDPTKRPFPATWLRGGRWKSQEHTEPPAIQRHANDSPSKLGWLFEQGGHDPPDDGCVIDGSATELCSHGGLPN